MLAETDLHSTQHIPHNRIQQRPLVRHSHLGSPCHAPPADCHSPITSCRVASQ
jgi:hypothetical protein